MVDDRFGIVGKVIARTYEVRAVVAEGGFGVVYRAYHQGFRAEVCLKIPGELTEAQRQSFLEQFRGEAEVLFRLSSHCGNIVRPLHVDAFHTSDGLLVPFMAMEWLEGCTLDGLMMRRVEKGKPPISLKKLVRLLTPVASALEMAHNLPGKDGPEIVVHRDMKPENLFIARVGDEDIAKILDFGISKVKSTASQMVGRASAQADALVSFSPAYGAPEQWAPRRYGQTGRWTDVWGLALTVVEAAKGDEVVTGDHAAMMGTILDPVRRPSPSNEGIEVSAETERVFCRALAVDPKDRYQSVGDFWDELTGALGVQRDVGGPVSFRHQRSSKRATTGFDSVRPPPIVPELPDVGASQTQLKVPVPGALPAPSIPGAFSAPVGGGYGAKVSPLRSSQGEQARAPLDSGFGGGMPLASRPRPIPYQSHRSYAPQAQHSVMKALSPAFSLIALSVALTLLDRAHAHARGVPFSIGGIQVSWVAGGFMVLALITGFLALRRTWED